MPKMKEMKNKHELVRLAYHFKFEKQFKEPCQEWLDMIETMCNEILGNYTKKEDQLMTVAFDTRPKRRLNRVMDALKFEYPDYERLDKGAKGVKRKRVVSILSRQAVRMVKEDEKASKKRKTTPELKAATAKKRKAESLEPKITEAAEETPSTPPAAGIAEILKVMTESLPIKLLSPLGPELMKLLQKKDEPSATKKKADWQKKRRIVAVMQAIEWTPLSASASKITPIASTEAVAEANTSAEAAAAAEAANLESTLSGIDKMLSDMAAEETAAAAEKAMATVSGKGKKIVDAASEEMDFYLRNLVGQELSKAEKKELQEYGISCGYQPGAMFFGGIDEGALGCIRDRAGAKIIGTMSKSVGFLKLAADISGYRRQHIVGSLFYSNFKVKLCCLNFFYLCDEARFSDVGLSLQSMLLSKALRMQQDIEDKKNEIIIEGLESKIKDYEATLEKKDFLLQATEGSLIELQTKNARLTEQLLQAQEILKKNSECFEQEKKRTASKMQSRS
jgi:heat shock protein HslJ